MPIPVAGSNIPEWLPIGESRADLVRESRGQSSLTNVLVGRYLGRPRRQETAVVVSQTSIN